MSLNSYIVLVKRVPLNYDKKLYAPKCKEITLKSYSKELSLCPPH